MKLKTTHTEQEAQNYLPNASEYYYDKYSRDDESKFIITKRSWKSIKQNNSSGKYLTDKELEYVSLINGFLKNAFYGVEYFTLEFLCSELGITERHLRRIRKNTSHIFKTKWRKITPSHKGLLKKVYAVRPTEHTVFLLGETNYYKSKYNSFVNNSVKSVKLGHQCPTSIYKDEKNINIRSRANFLNAKNSKPETLNTELEENQTLVAKGKSGGSLANIPTTETTETAQEAQVVEIQSPKAATVTPIQTKPSRPRNKRKTKTQAEQKQRKASTVPATNIVKNGFLGGSKRISEIQPYLTDELCETLRSKSGKLFTNKAIREITKAIAASKKGSKAVFQHVNGIVAYLTPALIKEKRDPNKIGGEGYYTLAGMTEEDKQLHKQENYLNQVENSGIHARCDYTQFRARIAGQFPINLAYTLLTSMTGVKRQENVLKLTMHKQVPLSQHYKQLLLKHATGVGGYAGVSELEFVVIASNSNIRPEKALSCERQTSGEEPRSPVTYPKGISQSTDSALVRLWEELQLTEGIWDKVCSSFISEYGENGQALYSHWLAPLSVVEKDGIIELSTTSDMVRDRIEQTYLPFLVKVAGKFGINKVEFAV